MYFDDAMQLALPRRADAFCDKYDDQYTRAKSAVNGLRPPFLLDNESVEGDDAKLSELWWPTGTVIACAAWKDVASTISG
jgi:hypothetical protein